MSVTKATSAGRRGPRGRMLFAAPVVAALSAGEKNGTAFQPSANRPSFVNVTGKLSGLLNVTSSVTVSIGPAQAGPWSEVALFTLTVNAAGVGVSDSNTGSFPVPDGWWARVTQTGVSLLGNVAMNRIVWTA